MVTMLGIPVVSAALSRSPNSVVQLAGYQVAFTLVWLMRTTIYALPEVVIPLDAHGLARLAAKLREPKEAPQVDIDHVHAPRIDIKAHSRAVVERLRAVGTASFRSLCAGCTETLEVVVRFLALLELHRDGTVAFDQPTPLGDITVTWVGGSGAPDEQQEGEPA